MLAVVDARFEELRTTRGIARRQPVDAVCGISVAELATDWICGLNDIAERVVLKLLQLRRALSKGTVAAANAAVKLRFEDGTAYPQLGTVEFAEITVAEDTGSVTLRAKFPNPDGFLLPCMFVRVEVPQSVLKDAIVVPQQGIARGAKGDATAFVVGPDNKVEERSVAATQAIRDKWLVTSGLKAGDRLIVEGTSKVKAGATVKPVAVTLP